MSKDLFVFDVHAHLDEVEELENKLKEAKSRGVSVRQTIDTPL